MVQEYLELFSYVLMIIQYAEYGNCLCLAVDMIDDGIFYSPEKRNIT